MTRRPSCFERNAAVLSRLPGSYPTRHVRCGHGPCNKITLTNVTSQFAQDIPVTLILDAFCHGLQSELVRHSKTRIAESLQRRIRRCTVNKAAIHLEFVERQIAQLCQRGVAGTEIVDR